METPSQEHCLVCTSLEGNTDLEGFVCSTTVPIPSKGESLVYLSYTLPVLSPSLA